LRVRDGVGVQGVPEPVGRQDVEPAVANEGSRLGDGVEDPLDARPHLLGRLRAAARWSLLRGVDQVEQVGPLDIVEMQRVGDGVEDVVGDAANGAAFELRVVLDADPGEHRHFLAPDPEARRRVP
jgi:hypothetical protein